MSVNIVYTIDVIIQSFVELYFGHVSLIMPAWSDLEQYSDNYLASSSSKSKDQVAENCSRLQGQLANIIVHHPLNRFPVSKKYLAEVLSWIHRLFAKQGLEIMNETLEHLTKQEQALRPDQQEEPEFIFKVRDHDTISSHHEC